MDKFFKIRERGSTVKTEIVAGITTFLAMAYILAVNPSILSASGMDKGAVFTATAISAAFATILMGVFANYPIALASGMGLNAYFAYTVVPALAEMGVTDPWRVALTAILVEGIIFIILSLFKFREAIVNGVPANLKYGITAGIGLFITLIGLKSAGIVVANTSTLVDLGSFRTPQVVLALVGIVITAILWHYKIKGSILIGILATWVLGIVAELCGWYVVDVEAGVYSLIPSFTAGGFLPPSLAPTFFKFDFSFVAKHALTFAVVTFAFLFVDLFDTVGTVIGVASEGNLLDSEGKLPRAGRVLLTDAIGTVEGAMLGTSTVTSYVESTAGVAAGGRTGLTAISTGVMLLLSLFLSPIFLAVPGFATTPALVFVGMLMMKAVLKMDFSADVADTIGGFLAIAIMPFTYSIANGIMLGMVSWVILKVCTGKIRDVKPVMWVSFGLFALRIATMVIPGLSL